MTTTDREMADRIAEVLRPLARAYAAQHPNIQAALAAQVMVRVDYLRDAYLALAHYDAVRAEEDECLSCGAVNAHTATCPRNPRNR